jgi:hypothetical protein
VWREADLFDARRAHHVPKPQTSLSVDLFEVIAELADLDLANATQPAEALDRAAHAQRRLRST